MYITSVFWLCFLVNYSLSTGFLNSWINSQSPSRSITPARSKWCSIFTQHSCPLPKLSLNKHCYQHAKHLKVRWLTLCPVCIYNCKNVQICMYIRGNILLLFHYIHLFQMPFFYWNSLTEKGRGVEYIGYCWQ